MRIRTIAVGVTFTLATGIGSVALADGSTSTSGIVADFEGQRINLAEGWGEARACTSDGVVTTCYRSEAAMDRAGAVAVSSGGVVPLATCSSSLRLYRSTSYGGAVLQLTTRGTYINLSGYGFDNDTSSYKVGACSSGFYDGASGGAPTYPGSTSANASATSMVSGWDNRVSSVYIS